MAVVPDVLGIPASHAVLKVRSPQRGAEQYQKLRESGVVPGGGGGGTAISGQPHGLS